MSGATCSRLGPAGPSWGKAASHSAPSMAGHGLWSSTAISAALAVTSSTGRTKRRPVTPYQRPATTSRPSATSKLSSANSMRASSDPRAVATGSTVPGYYGSNRCPTTATTSSSACSSRPSARQADAVVELSRLADVVGLDLVSFQDHPYQPRVPGHLDAAVGRRGGDDQRPRRAERRQPAAAPAGRAGPQRRQPRHPQRRPGRARARRRRVLGRDRRDGRPAADARGERRRAGRGDRRHPGDLERRRRPGPRTTARTTGSTARSPARRPRTTSRSGSAPTSRGCCG